MTGGGTDAVALGSVPGLVAVATGVDVARESGVGP
jgi:hypothetical protein